jgi:4-hydroxy-tetrahydrodipicolinate synthase
MSPATRLPIVPLDDAARIEVARAFAAIADEELIDSVGA